MRKLSSFAGAVLLLSAFAIAQQPAPKSEFEPLAFFVGHWQGTTHGDPGNGTGERTYGFVLRTKFLRVTNKTTYPPQKANPKGEVHEDLGLFSYDRQQKRLVLRQFHVEGFVNEYAQQPTTADSKTLVFETTAIENIPAGWRARETYKVVSRDEFIEIFELAEPGKDFVLYSEGRWKRVK